MNVHKTLSSKLRQSRCLRITFLGRSSTVVRLVRFHKRWSKQKKNTGKIPGTIGGLKQLPVNRIVIVLVVTEQVGKENAEADDYWI
jgi:hypothetical protein